MIITPLSLTGACLIQGEPIRDARGYFVRCFCSTEFKNHGLVTEYPQHSLSYNAMRGTLRGLHFQPAPYEEAKVVRCSRGSIHDVIADLRNNSATFGHWQAFELSADNNLALYIPAGFAHGFITLTAAAEVHYMISREHVPHHGRSIRWDDPDLAIQWPLRPEIMSDNDRNAPAFRELTGN